MRSTSARAPCRCRRRGDCAMSTVSRGQAYLSATVLGRPPAAASRRAERGRRRRRILALAATCRCCALSAPRCSSPVTTRAGQPDQAVAQLPDHVDARADGRGLHAQRKGGHRPEHAVRDHDGQLFQSPVHRNYGRLMLERAYDKPGAPVTWRSRTPRCSWTPVASTRWRCRMRPLPATAFARHGERSRRQGLRHAAGRRAARRRPYIDPRARHPRHACDDCPRERCNSARQIPPLNLLHAQDRRLMSRLCAGLPMARQAARQHLAPAGDCLCSARDHCALGRYAR